MFARGCRKVGPQKSSLFMKEPTAKVSAAEALRGRLLKLAKVQPMAAAKIAAERGITL
jgi:hypothetical protein